MTMTAKHREPASIDFIARCRYMYVHVSQPYRSQASRHLIFKCSVELYLHNAQAAKWGSIELNDGKRFNHGKAIASNHDKKGEKIERENVEKD